jgi:hypothetical protein
MRRISFVFLPLTLLLAQPKIDKNALPGYESITADDLSAHLHFLASPELEGRETSFRGQKVAARYIAAAFQKLGLKPIGDKGTYFQHLDLEVTRISERTTITLSVPSGKKEFWIRKDFLTNSTRDTVLEAPVVFVGYADQAFSNESEELIKGKIVLTLAGTKSPAEEAGTRSSRRLFATRPYPGAVATLVILNETGPTSLPSLVNRFSNAIDKGSMRLVGGESRRRAPSSSTYYVSSELAREILAGAGTTIETVRSSATGESFQPLTLGNVAARIDSKIARDIKQSENVIGMLEGSDPKLKNEIVIFTAHYDHLGVNADGQINPGADDDGSGTAAVLELAEAFAVNPVKPKRSLVFMTVTGEEKGLLGSYYYSQNPIIPMEKTIANLNTDMIGRVDKKYEAMNNPNYVYVIGSDKISTELDSVLRVSNASSENLLLDYTFNDDKDPNQFYRRSDHFNFARNGVPVVFYFTGVHDDYHRPTDTVDKILFGRAARITRLIFVTGWNTANFPRMFVKNASSAVYQ